MRVRAISIVVDSHPVILTTAWDGVEDTQTARETQDIEVVYVNSRWVEK